MCVECFGFVELFINVQRNFFVVENLRASLFLVWRSILEMQILLFHFLANNVAREGQGVTERKRVGEGEFGTHVSKVWSNYLLNIITVFRF